MLSLSFGVFPGLRGLGDLGRDLGEEGICYH